MAQEIVGKTQFEAEVLQSAVPVLADFWAPHCPPCRQIAKDIDDLAATVSGAKVVKVNVEHNPELAGEHRITGIPALVFFKDGQEVRRHLGVRSRQSLAADLEALKRN